MWDTLVQVLFNHIRSEFILSILDLGVWHTQLGIHNVRHLFQPSQVGSRGSQLYCWQLQTSLRRGAVGCVQHNQLSISNVWLGCPVCGNEQCWQLLVAHQSFQAASTRWQYLKRKAQQKLGWVCSDGYWGSNFWFDQWTRQAAHAGWLWEVVANVTYFLYPFMRPRYSLNPEIFLLLLRTHFPPIVSLHNFLLNSHLLLPF